MGISGVFVDDMKITSTFKTYVGGRPQNVWREMREKIKIRKYLIALYCFKRLTTKRYCFFL